MPQERAVNVDLCHVKSAVPLRMALLLLLLLLRLRLPPLSPLTDQTLCPVPNSEPRITNLIDGSWDSLTGGIGPSQSRYVLRTANHIGRRKHTFMPRFGFERIMQQFERAKTIHASYFLATVKGKISHFVGKTCSHNSTPVLHIKYG
jgi:hypothetical protein